MKHWSPGNVVEIALDGAWAYGQVVDDPLMGFYPVRTSQICDPADLASEEFCFRIWVMKYAIGKNGWPIVGSLELTDEKASEPWFFKKDPISGALTRYLGSTMEEIPISLEESEGLECAAVWDPEHVESRLRDEAAGRPNIWVESMRPDWDKNAQQGEAPNRGSLS